MTILSNRKPGPAKAAPTEPLKQAVAGCMRALAKTARNRDRLRLRQAGALRRREGAPSRAAAQALGRGCRGAARPRRFDGAQARLPRSRRASAPRAARPRGALAFRFGRAGEGRGDRRQTHGGRRLEPHRHVAGPLSSWRQIRGHHRAGRRSARRRGRAHGARAADGRISPARREEARRSLARRDRGQGRQPSSIGSTARSTTSALSPAIMRDVLAHLDMAEAADFESEESEESDDDQSEENKQQEGEESEEGSSREQAEMEFERSFRGGARGRHERGFRCSLERIAG